MEVAFFPVNDLKTDKTPAAKASFGEEFSAMLASFMPQAVPTDAFFGGEAPFVDRAGVEGGAFTGLTDAKGLTAGALIETARLDGKAEMPVSSDLNEDEASFQAISEEPGLFAVDSFNYTPAALQQGLPGEGVRAAESTSSAQMPALKPAPVEPTHDSGASTWDEKARFCVPLAKEPLESLMRPEKTLEKAVEEPAPQPAIDSSDADPAASGLLSLFTDSNDRTAEARGGALDSVRSDELDGAEMAISFSNGFEGDRQEQDSTGETDRQSIAIEPHQMKADGAVHGPSFGKHLETSSLDPLPAVVKSAPAVLEVMDRVEAGIRLSADAGGGEVRMKLNPEALGEVRIKLDVSSGVVKAEITVESREVKAMIEADSAFLKDALSSHGLTLDKCVVEVAKNADLKARNENAWSDSSGDERASGNRGQEKGSGNWHGGFQKERERAEDSGVDFFI